MKRIFALTDCKLSRVVQLCDVLALLVDDIVAQASLTRIEPLPLGD